MSRREEYQQRAEALLTPIVEEQGFDLVDVEYVKEAGCWYLRGYIDNPGGITVNDCEAVSRPLSDILDEKDPISQGYFLEVGSAGLERELVRESHFESCRGSLVQVKMIRPLDGVKEFTAVLADFTKETAVFEFPVDTGDENRENIEIALADIANIKLYEDINEYL